MNEEAILSRISKLLNLATSDNVSEAEIAASKAQELLLKYNISENELNEFRAEKQEKVIEVRTAGKNSRNKSGWSINLASVVAKANLCTILTSGAGLIWIGKKSNIEIAQYIHDMLSNDLMRIADIEFAIYKARGGDYHGKTWKNSFYYGAIQSIKERLNANLLQLKEADPGISALVVNNDVEIKDYMDEHYRYLSYSKFTGSKSSSAFSSGKAAGASIQFRQGISGGSAAGQKMLKGRN